MNMTDVEKMIERRDDGIHRINGDKQTKKRLLKTLTHRLMIASILIKML
jgi:hypothetical protein